jgi:hypothetical protein
MAPKMCCGGAFTRSCPNGLEIGALATTYCRDVIITKGIVMGQRKAFLVSMLKDVSLYLQQFWSNLGILANEISQFF